MILTQCAVCAAPLGLALGKKCSRCSTRYCGPACQKNHWEEGGHDKLCKKIKKGGGAEQYNAEKKYAEAVKVAADACAAETKGQTCYICTEAVHWKTKEGLVRGCSCRGTAGFAHVSCLAEQAKILLEEAEENNLDIYPRWARWYTCGLCKQQYHGVAYCALGWACWKTYLGRSEEEWVWSSAMTQLGNGLCDAKHYEDALSVREAELSMLLRLGAPEGDMLVTQDNIATTLCHLGRQDEALCIKRDVYSGRLKLNGEDRRATLIAANNYAATLKSLNHFGEVKTLLGRMVPVARRVLGESNDVTLKMRRMYASALCRDTGATLDDLREAVTRFEDTERVARRVLGGGHPFTKETEGELRNARGVLCVCESV